MQKVINVLALISFAGVAGIVGGKDAIIEDVKEQVTKHATEAIAEALPNMLDSAVPELPSVTGGAKNSSSGLPLPSNLEFFNSP
jgi:hypothetical protein